MRARKSTAVMAALGMVCVVVALLCWAPDLRAPDKGSHPPAIAGTSATGRVAGTPEAPVGPGVSPGLASGSADGALAGSTGASNEGMLLPEMGQGFLEREFLKDQASLLLAEWKVQWAREDEFLKAIPSFDSVREDYRKRALEQVQEGVVDLNATDALAEATRAAIDRFWEEVEPDGPPGCEQLYLQRALLELALEEHPQDFTLLTCLRDTIASTTVLMDAEGRRRPEVYRELLPVVERQKQLIEAGSVPPGVNSFEAMYDWIWLNTYNPESQAATDKGEIVSGYDWLIEHADEGQWAHLSDQLRKCRHEAEVGRVPSYFLIYRPKAKDSTLGQDDPVSNPLPAVVRRTPSYCGSRKMRESLEPLVGAGVQTTTFRDFPL